MKKRDVRRSPSIEVLEPRLVLSGWAVSDYSPSTSSAGRAVAVDSAGDVYVAGWFSGVENFGGITLKSQKSSSGNYSIDAFAEKLNSSGTVLWALDFGGPNTDQATSIALDAAGDAYVIGNFTGSATFAGSNGVATTLSGFGSNTGAFVASISPDGSSVSAWQFGATGSNDTGGGIALGADGGLFITGNFGSSATFGTTTLSSPDSSNLYIAKLATSGTVDWAVSVDNATAGNVLPYSPNLITTYLNPTTSTEEIDLGGTYTGTATFGAGSLTTSNSSGDGFIAQIADNGTAGNFTWAEDPNVLEPQGLLCTGSKVSGVAVDSSGNVYVTGEYAGDVSTPGFLTKLGPTSGAVDWFDQFDSGNSTGIAVDGLGDVYITGLFGSSDFAPSPGIADVVGPSNAIFSGIGVYDTNGDFLDVRRMGGQSATYGWGIAVDGSDDIITTGATFGPTLFDDGGTTGDVQLDGTSSGSAWVVKTTQESGGIFGLVYEDLLDDGIYSTSPVAGPSLSDPSSKTATADTLYGADSVLPSWTVDLYQNGSLLESQATSSIGSYSFDHLTPGSYQVVAVPETGWTQTEPAFGTQIDGVYAATVTVAAGQGNASVNFGEWIPTQWLTYASTDVPVSFKALGATTATLTVGDTYPVLAAAANFDETTANDAEAGNSLMPPGYTSASFELFAGEAYGYGAGQFAGSGNSNTNFVNTTVDTASPATIVTASAPFNGTYQSQTGIVAGTPAAGTWTMDLEGGVAGKLTRWWMSLLGPQYASIGNLNPSVSGSKVTLSISGFSDLLRDAESSISFYEDANSDGRLEVGADTLLGTATPGNGGAASLSVSGLASGTYTFFAQAHDSQGQPSNVLSISVTVGSSSKNDLVVSSSIAKSPHTADVLPSSAPITEFFLPTSSVPVTITGAMNAVDTPSVVPVVEPAESNLIPILLDDAEFMDSLDGLKRRPSL